MCTFITVTETNDPHFFKVEIKDISGVLRLKVIFFYENIGFKDYFRLTIITPFSGLYMVNPINPPHPLPHPPPYPYCYPLLTYTPGMR